MAPRPTVIGTQGYRRGLASLSVVKERLFRVHRNARRSYLRPRVPALLTSACAEFLLRVLAALRLVLEIPCGTSCNQPLATNHCCKIKNPASSAGYSHSHLSGSTRCSTS